MSCSCCFHTTIIWKPAMQAEAQMAAALFWELRNFLLDAFQMGRKPNGVKVGIITFYKAQVDLIRDTFKQLEIQSGTPGLYAEVSLRNDQSPPWACPGSPSQAKLQMLVLLCAQWNTLRQCFTARIAHAKIRTAAACPLLIGEVHGVTSALGNSKLLTYLSNGESGFTASKC